MSIKTLAIFFVFISALFIASFTPAKANSLLSDIEITEVSSINSVFMGELAYYTLKITNTGAEFLKLQIVPDPFVGLKGSYFSYILIEPDIIELNAGESVDINLKIKLKDTVDPGHFYTSYIQIKSLTTEFKEKYPIEAYLLNPEDFAYLSLNLPDYVKPGSELKVNFTLKNRLKRDLSNVQVYITSSPKLFDEDKKDIQVFALQERTDTFSYAISELAPAGKYTLSIRLYYMGEQITAISKEFYVLSTSDILEQINEEKRFLMKITKVKETNTGNSLASGTSIYALTKFQSYFTEAAYGDKTEANIVWSFTLEPGQSIENTIITDYRGLFVVALLLVVFICFAVYWFTRGISIRKKVFSRKNIEGITKFKVVLHIKNQGRKPVENAMIIDILPAITKSGEHFGTVKPDEIEHGDRGTRLIWKLAKLDRGEERIFSYEAETKVGVVGLLHLPSAIVRFKGEKGKISSIKSNTTNVHG